MAARSKYNVFYIIGFVSASLVNAAMVADGKMSRWSIRWPHQCLHYKYEVSTGHFCADEFILVVGGEVGEYGDASFISDSATLISPDPIGAPVPECNRNLTEFPLQIYGGAGAVIGTKV